MSRRVEIRGGAGEFEAAVIAVVLDRIAQEEATLHQGRGRSRPGLSAWVKAIRNHDDLSSGSWASRKDFPQLG
jgi:hypothetical protein